MINAAASPAHADRSCRPELAFAVVKVIATAFL
jgi:hypothetical protein